MLHENISSECAVLLSAKPTEPFQIRRVTSAKTISPILSNIYFSFSREWHYHNFHAQLNRAASFGSWALTYKHSLIRVNSPLHQLYPIAFEHCNKTPQQKFIADCRNFAENFCPYVEQREEAWNKHRTHTHWPHSPTASHNKCSRQIQTYRLHSTPTISESPRMPQGYL